MAMRKAQHYSAKALESAAQVLKINPEFNTMWNYRREILLDMFEKKAQENQEHPVDTAPAPAPAPAPDTASDTASAAPAAPADDEFLKWKKQLLLFEIKLTEESIRSHPKSYAVWNYRRWVTQQLDSLPATSTTSAPNTDTHCNWNDELRLCSQFLKYDSRNFHCWDYRRYVVGVGKIATDKQEFDYTTQLININFSNYSAWHQRSVLLPKLFSNVDPKPFCDALDQEFELVKQAFYTEPADQSAWFYHRWLRAQSSKFPGNKSKEILKRELQMCDELLSIEPDSKWALLTKVFILSEMDFDGGTTKGEALNILQRLQTIDADHFHYYKEQIPSISKK